MPTPLLKLGTLRRLASGWEARISIDNGKRPGFALTAIAPSDELGARERCNAMALIALRVRRAGCGSDLEELLKIAARARAGKPWDVVLAAADRLCAGTTEPVSDAARVTVADLGKAWRSGELHRLHQLHVKPKKSSKRDEEIARIYVDPVIGDRRVAEVTLDDADEVMADVPERHAAAFRDRHAKLRKHPRKAGAAPPKRRPPPAPATLRHVAQYLRRLLGYASYPCRLLVANPIPKGWLPRVSESKAKECLYPDEDRALLGATAVPLVRRLVYGFLAREGMRADELARLEWRDVDLERGRVDLDTNKTNDARSWDLDPGVQRALAVWKAAFCPRAKERDRVFSEHGAPLKIPALARLLRRDLARAGVTRSKLFERSATRQPIRAHDLRATFTTIALATGHTETWVADRTGHRSSVMINRYRRRARTWKLGPLDALDLAIPELAARAAKPPASPRDDNRAGHELAMTVPNGAVPWSQPPTIVDAGARGEPSFTAPAALSDGGSSGARSRDLRIKSAPQEGLEGTREASGGDDETIQESSGESEAADSRVHAYGQNLASSTLEVRGGAASNAVENALVRALEQAAAAGRFDVVVQLARELEARRLGASTNVVRLDSGARPHRK